MASQIYLGAGRGGEAVNGVFECVLDGVTKDDGFAGGHPFDALDGFQGLGLGVDDEGEDVVLSEAVDGGFEIDEAGNIEGGYGFEVDDDGVYATF